MKRLFRGFTLAEVLITLGMIGVIASMTLPALTINVQKQQVGPALAKAVNTIQTSAKVLLQDTGTRNLRDACSQFDTEEFVDCLYESGVGLYNKESATRTFSKSVGGEAITLGDCVMGNDGISFCPLTKDSTGSTSNTNLNKRYYGEFYQFYIDTNGPKKPDIIGKDVFLVYLDMSGVVLPYGGNAWKDYMSKTDSWDTQCKKTIVDADYCAGAIADNAWQVKYNY